MHEPVTLVHERLTEWGGSENVVREMRKVWPQAPLYTPIADESMDVDGLKPRTGGLQKLYRGGNGYAQLLPLLPRAMRSLPLGSTDVVVASHFMFANQVVWATDAPVVSYVHSPARWMWDPAKRKGEVGGKAGELSLAAMSAVFRKRDYTAAQRVRLLLANSTAVQERIQKWWDRESTVLHPPVDIDFFNPDPSVEREDFVLVAGRLVPYKRPDLAIRASELAGVKIVVAGEGRAMGDCRREAGSQTTFVGRPSNDELLDLYRRCSAVVMPGEEDFGIIPVEAQACGAPVVAIASGGTMDTVVDGETGFLVSPGETEDLFVAAFAEALRGLATTKFDSGAVRANAEKFSADQFRAGIAAAVASVQP